MLSGDDPAAHDLWRREGLVMPVATRSIWLAVALIAIGLFLADVGVRRVRIEPKAIMGAITRALGASSSSAGGQIDSLKAAREKARQRMADRGEAKEQAQDNARRRFEPDPESPVSAGPVALGGEPMRDDKPKAPKPEQPQGEDDGLSRLMKAKRRAQEEFDDE